MISWIPFITGIAIAAFIIVFIVAWRQEKIRRNVSTLDSILLVVLKSIDAGVMPVVEPTAPLAVVPPPILEVRCRGCAGKGEYAAGNFGPVTCDECGGAGVVDA